MAAPAETLRFLGHVRLGGTIILLSGLHIGAGKDTIEIGGIDNPVVKHPHTGDPYIPGSSLKGKLRFLMEWAFQPAWDTISAGHGPWGSDRSDPVRLDDPVLRIFGTPAKQWDGGPTRLIVRDAPLNAAWRRQIVEEGLPLTEEKAEVVIDRIQGKAHRIGPRHTERVPAGARFDLAMSFRLYDVGGDGGAYDRKCLNWLLAGLSLLEQDALGGSGSRGYGRIRFEDLVCHDIDGSEHRLDNRFRVARFDPKEAPDILAAVA